MPKNTTVQDTAALDLEKLDDKQLNDLMFGTPDDKPKAENPVIETTETTEGSSPAEAPAVIPDGSEQQAEPEKPPAEEPPAEPVPAEPEQKATPPAEKTVPLDVLLVERKKHQEKLKQAELKYEKIKSQIITTKPVELTPAEIAYFEKQREFDPEGADLWKQAVIEGKRQTAVTVEGMQVANKMQSQSDTETEMINAALDLYPDLAKPDSELNKKATEIFDEWKSITGDNTIARIKAAKQASEYLEAKQSAASREVLGSKALAVQARPMTGGGSSTTPPQTTEQLIDRVSRELYGD